MTPQDSERPTVAWWVMLTSLMVLGMLLVSGAKAHAVAHLMFDLRDRGKTINNKYSMLNSWFYDPTWRSVAAEQPADYMKTKYPFVETVHLMTATGGVDWRDLFLNPYDRTILNDYNFEKLKDAIRQILRQGLKPCIKTGNVPEKYSNPPVIGNDFGANLRPPDDYDVYYRFIRALALDLVREFGLDEVKTWMWGVLTEYENKSWFDAGTPEETKIAYFKLYDYTVAALEDALGPENVIVGAHSMSVLEGYWDELEFIEHVARGVNYKTGEIGTQLDFLSVSFYDRTLRGLDHQLLIDTVNHVRNKAEELGLTGLRYGVDEGRVLQGWDFNKPLVSAALNMSAQGAADAKLFKVLLDHDIDWFALWSLSTDGTWGGANAIGSNIANLAYRMVGDQRIGGEIVQRSEHPHVDIDGIASYDADEQTLRVMVYNVQRDPITGTDDDVVIEIRHIAAVDGETVTVEQWRVDDDHANWWPAWKADEAERGLTDEDYDWSKYSVEIPEVLLNPEDLEFWRSREPVYYELSQLKSTVFEVSVKDGVLQIADYLPGHGVAFYEIRGVAPAP